MTRDLKFLSGVLRLGRELIDLRLYEPGWILVNELLVERPSPPRSCAGYRRHR